MEIWVRIAWAALALVHVMPAAVAAAPRLVDRLYGVPPGGDVGVLLVHRGFLFLAVLVAAAWAIFDPAGRRLATAVVAISIIGFLFVYLRAGAPAGPLRTIAVADAAALIPLAFVTLAAWRADPS